MYSNSKRSEKNLRYQNICDMNSIPLGIQQIKIPVYQIIGTFHFIPHPSCTDFNKKTNSNWNNFLVFKFIAACFSHGESQTHLYCPGNCPKNWGAHQWRKAATGSQAVCTLEYNGIVHVEFVEMFTHIV